MFPRYNHYGICHPVLHPYLTTMPLVRRNFQQSIRSYNFGAFRLQNSVWSGAITYTPAKRDLTTSPHDSCFFSFRTTCQPFAVRIQQASSSSQKQPHHKNMKQPIRYYRFSRLKLHPHTPSGFPYLTAWYSHPRLAS